MKSEKTIETATISFWEWFRSHSAKLHEVHEDAQLLRDLDLRMISLNPKLSWEIGPGKIERSQFVISPNLAADLRCEAESIISCAPEVNGWEFSALRRPKQWDFKLTLSQENGKSIHIDATHWKYVLLNYPEGSREIILEANAPLELSEADRWKAGAIVLESILGEKVLLDFGADFDVVDYLEPRFACKACPIQELSKAFNIS